MQEAVALPADVAAGLDEWGIEGVSTMNDARGSTPSSRFSAGLTTDPGGLAVRRGSVATTSRPARGRGSPTRWSSASDAGDWIGLSEVVALDDDSLAVVERDKLNGPNARIKRVYQVDLPRPTRHPARSPC